MGKTPKSPSRAPRLELCAPYKHHSNPRDRKHTVVFTMNTGWLHGGLRVLALLWTLLITALIGNVMASNINAASSATQAINFTMFVAAWSWVACLVGLAAIIVTALAIPWLLFPLDILAVLFTFISAVVMWFLWATFIGCLFFTYKQASGLLGGRSFG